MAICAHELAHMCTPTHAHIYTPISQAHIQHEKVNFQMVYVHMSVLSSNFKEFIDFFNFKS